MSTSKCCGANRLVLAVWLVPLPRYMFDENALTVDE